MEYDTQISGGWDRGDVIAKDINGKRAIKAFVKTLFAYDFGFVRIQHQLVIVHPVFDLNKGILKIMESLKLDGIRVDGILTDWKR